MVHTVLPAAHDELERFRRLLADRDQKIRYLENLVQVFKEERSALTRKMAGLRELLNRTLEEKQQTTHRLKDLAGRLAPNADPREDRREDRQTGPQSGPEARADQPRIKPEIQYPEYDPARLHTHAEPGPEEDILARHEELFRKVIEKRCPEDVDLEELERVVAEVLACTNPGRLDLRLVTPDIPARAARGLHLINVARTAMFIGAAMDRDESNLCCLGICAILSDQPGSRWLAGDNPHEYARVLRVTTYFEYLVSPVETQCKHTPLEALRRLWTRAQREDVDERVVRTFIQALGGQCPASSVSVPLGESRSAK